jgi:3-deoxy-D-arabino-heptulosonate 7-phosphate (DAHP) synthase class II
MGFVGNVFSAALTDTTMEANNINKKAEIIISEETFLLSYEKTLLDMRSSLRKHYPNCIAQT